MELRNRAQRRLTGAAVNILFTSLHMLKVDQGWCLFGGAYTLLSYHTIITLLLSFVRKMHVIYLPYSRVTLQAACPKKNTFWCVSVMHLYPTLIPSKYRTRLLIVYHLPKT